MRGCKGRTWRALGGAIRVGGRGCIRGKRTCVEVLHDGYRIDRGCCPGTVQLPMLIRHLSSNLRHTRHLGYPQTTLVLGQSATPLKKAISALFPSPTADLSFIYHPHHKARSPSFHTPGTYLTLQPAFPLLLSTLLLLSPLPPSKPVPIYFCWKKRRKADRRFFGMLKKHFDSVHVEDDRPGAREVYAREGVSLLLLTRRR